MRKPTTQLEQPKIQADAKKLQEGLAKLVLTVVDLLRQILEKQAQRRIEEGTLDDVEIERLGISFMQIKQTMDGLSEKFGIKPEDLRLNAGSILGSSASLQKGTSLADLVDKLLERGTVVGGNVTISVADVDLIELNLLAMLSAVKPVRRKRRTK